MTVNLVSDADVRAVSIVGKGANRKRFFLTKAEGEQAEPLPSAERLVKAADWSAVYCVVAEPGWHESPGSAPGTDQSVEDRWASEDEIRKAAHRFMANGGLVTKMHESLEPYGQLVENAVALADFTVDGETIRKGSWYIAIEPTDEGKAAIEKGEFTGVSIEGLARREEVEKAGNNPHDHPKEPFSESKTSNWVARVGGLPPYIQHVAHALVDSGHPESKAISMAVGIVRNWSEGKGKVGKPVQAAAAKAIAEWEAKKAKAKVKKGTDESEVEAWLATLEGSGEGSPTVKTVDDTAQKSFLRKLAEKLGIEMDETEEVAKANLTFGAIVTQREFEDALPDAFSAFRESVYRAFFPDPQEGFDPNAHLSQSCDEFKEWCLSMLDKVPVSKEDRAEALGVEVTPDGSTIETRKKDGDMALTDAERQEFDGLKKAVEEMPATITAALAKALGGGGAEDADPTPESVAKAIKDLRGADESEVEARVAKIEADIKKLAEGDSSQTGDDGDEPVQKQDAEAIAKAFKKEGVNPALAGVL